MKDDIIKVGRIRFKIKEIHSNGYTMLNEKNKYKM